MQTWKRHDRRGYARLGCTAASLLLPSIAFFAFVLPHATRSAPLLGVLSGIATSLMVAVFFFFLRASCTEPGSIVSPTDAATTPRNDIESQTWPPGREITMNGVAFISKWCPDCRIYRPPRARHCHVCKCCVQKFDHHCPWVSNCVGLRNYRYFFGFVMFLSTFVSLVFAVDIAAAVQMIASKHLPLTFGRFSRELFVHPLMLGLFVLSGCILCPLFNLSFFHCYLVSKNLTTGEEMRNMYRTFNPFSLGLVKNCRQSLCDEPTSDEST